MIVKITDYDLLKTVRYNPKFSKKRHLGIIVKKVGHNRNVYFPSLKTIVLLKKSQILPAKHQVSYNSFPKFILAEIEKTPYSFIKKINTHIYKRYTYAKLNIKQVGNKTYSTGCQEFVMNNIFSGYFLPVNLKSTMKLLGKTPTTLLCSWSTTNTYNLRQQTDILKMMKKFLMYYKLPITVKISSNKLLFNGKILAYPPITSFILKLMRAVIQLTYCLTSTDVNNIINLNMCEFASIFKIKYKAYVYDNFKIYEMIDKATIHKVLAECKAEVRFESRDGIIVFTRRLIHT